MTFFMVGLEGYDHKQRKKKGQVLRLFFIFVSPFYA